MWNRAETANDDAMLAVMRSFRADPERERDLIVQFLTSLPFYEADRYVEEIIESRNGT